MGEFIRTHRAIALAVLLLLAGCLIATGGVACGDPLTAADETQTAEGVAATSIATPSADGTVEGSETLTAAPTMAEPTQILEDEPTNVPDVYDLPTPASDSEAMVLGAYTYVNARPAIGRLAAYVGDQECGEAMSGFLGDATEAMLDIQISSDADRAGCGVPGATVSFTLDGQAVNETIVWQPGIQKDLVVDLSAGPRFAIYRGTFSLVAGFRSLLPGSRPLLLVTPYVDGHECGEAGTAYANLEDHARFVYRVAVQPAGLQEGCGSDGSIVVLRLQVEGGPTVDLATLPWQTLPVVQVPNVDLRRAVPRPTPEAVR